jgi:hypothetical protein
MPLLAADPVTVFDRAARSAGTAGRTHSHALERIAPGLPMAPGKVERREFEYRRHGTQMLIAALDVAHRQGRRRDHADRKDFARFLRRLLSSAAPDIRWESSATGLNSHLSEAVVRGRVFGY